MIKRGKKKRWHEFWKKKTLPYLKISLLMHDMQHMYVKQEKRKPSVMIRREPVVTEGLVLFKIY